jgi:hypothetical protein
VGFLTAPTKVQQEAIDFGLKGWGYSAKAMGTTLSPPTQRTQATTVWLPGGTLVTNVVVFLTTLASGTAPTNAFAGIADSTGKMLAQSGELKSNAGWTAGGGITAFPLSATYTTLAAGYFYAVLLVNGTWGTTQPTLGCAAVNTAVSTAGPNGVREWGIQSSQTALPANGASVTFDAGGDGRAIWLAFS